MPAYGGAAIFGTSVSMTTVDNPRRQQMNQFPGINGRESLDQGFDGRFTVVTGLLIAPDAATLNSLENLFRSYNDGYARTLVDNFGNSWDFVKLDSFEPEGKVRIAAGPGYVFRPYTARFLHL